MEPGHDAFFFQKIGENTYDFRNDYINEIVTFTDTGFNLRMIGEDGGADCTALRQ